jgi:flagellar hook-associated protein FlgK
LIESKASRQEVTSDMKNHEYKISLLDKNLINIADDFELLQQTVKQINEMMTELREANKEVLVGRRKLNCLSCGTTEK